MQVVPARTPAAAIKLGDAGDQDRAFIWAGHPLLFPAHRQLPAHIRLRLQWMQAGVECQLVQCAAKSLR